MTVATIQYPLAGTQVLGNFSSSIEVADNDTSYTPIVPVGTIVDFNDPYYGSGKAIRLCIPKNTTAIKVGTLAIYSAATNAGKLSNYSYVIAPVTANQSRPVAVSINAIPNNASYAQYAWFAIGGTLPVWMLAATAITDKVFISATAGAGFVTTTAGRQVVGMTPVVASTGTVVKAGTGASGAYTIKVSNTDGLFVGQVGSGTGVGTSTIITALSSDGTTVTVSVANSAAVTGNVTFTNNDSTNYFPICQFMFPFYQGNAT
jgi:hypothetical protein